MKILTALLLFLSISFSAQNQRFIYEYTFVKDSLEKDKTNTENMYLDITDKGSKYYSYEVFKMDSLMQDKIKDIANGSGISAPRSTRSFSVSGFSGKGSVSAVIKKDYPNYDVSQYEYLGMDAYKIEEDRKINWKISTETAKVGAFNTQKATTEMYGRKWIAWFSTDLPFQDGPYKFHGLPGLIVKLEDVSKSHIIELQGVQTLPKDYELQSLSNKERYNSLISLNYAKFKKAYKDNRANPMKSTKQMLSSVNMASMSGITDQNGNKIDFSKMMKEAETKMVEANKKDNNILELDLLK